GLLFAVFMASAALVSLPSGFLADRFGRKNALMFAILAQGLTQVGTGMTHSIPLLYGLQLCGGLGAAFMQTALMAAVADLAPANRMGQSMGWLTLSFQVGFLAGPALAGVALEVTDYQGDLLLMSVLYALAIPVALLGVKTGPLRRGQP